MWRAGQEQEGLGQAERVLQGPRLTESVLCPPNTLIKAMGPKSKLLKGKIKRCLRTISFAGIFPPVFYYDGEGVKKKKKNFYLALL